jgi:hypothetical protein
MTTINRAPFNLLIDDPGDNLTGTVWGKQDIKDVLLDPIDAALAQVDSKNYTSGAWTPSDSSGAGLVYVSKTGTWIRSGQMIVACGNVGVPSNASGAPVAIGGLVHPSIVGAPYWGGFMSYTTCNLLMTFPITGTVINAYAINGGPILNSQLAGQEIRFVIVYPTTAA